MSALFIPEPGRMVALRSESLRTFTIQVAGTSFEGVATSATVTQQVSAQISLALNQNIYVTPFGDQPGTMQVQYILNSVGCTPGDLTGSFMDFYNQNKLSPDNNKSPTLFALGNATYVGFIIGCQISANNDRGGTIITGSLQAAVWPS